MPAAFRSNTEVDGVYVQRFPFVKKKMPRTKRGILIGAANLAAKRSRFAVQPAYIMSMPPIPPIPPPPGIGVSSFGSSATMQSVVSIRPAMEAAFCSA